MKTYWINAARILPVALLALATFKVQAETDGQY